MVQLSDATERDDRLDVLAADRRQLEFVLTSSRPLRKGSNPSARRRLEAVRSEIGAQLREHLDAQSRRRFRDRIAVQMELSIPPGRNAARLGPVVKDYLDLLSGRVVGDDEAIDHLLVVRQDASDDLTRVRVRCVPLRLFNADYDRAFRLMSGWSAEVASDSAVSDGRSKMRDAAAVAPTLPWGLLPFDEHARESLAFDEEVLDVIEDIDAQEEEQLAEDPDAFPILDVPSTYAEFADEGVRASTRAQLEESTALARGDWLADQGFDVRDRPGPPRPWLREAVAHSEVDVVSLPDAGPGCVVLPAPRQRPTALSEDQWRDVVRAELARACRTGRWRRARFRGPIGLDIALRGRSGGWGDVENVARTVTVAFETLVRARDGRRVPRLSQASGSRRRPRPSHAQDPHRRACCRDG